MAPRCLPGTVVNAMHSLWTAVTALVLVFTSAAHAQEPSTPPATKPRVYHPLHRVKVYADLTYTRAPNAAVCPDEHEFRGQVAARMGVDSFKADPTGVYVGKVRVDVTRGPTGHVATYTWTDEEGVTRSERFTIKGFGEWPCWYSTGTLAAGITTFFVSKEIHYADMYEPRKKEPEPKSCPPAAPCPESPYSVWPMEPPMVAPYPEPAKPDRWPIAVRVGGMAWAELIATGWASLGLSADVGVRYRAVSFGAELHGNPPLGAQTIEDVRVSFARVSGAILACGHFGWFAGCGVADLGRYLFPDHVKALPGSTFYGTGGIRASMEFPVAPPRLFLRTSMDLRASLHPVSYQQMGRTVFQVAAPGVGLGLGLLLELPP